MISLGSFGQLIHRDFTESTAGFQTSGSSEKLSCVHGSIPVRFSVMKTSSPVCIYKSDCYVSMDFGSASGEYRAPAAFSPWCSFGARLGSLSPGRGRDWSVFRGQLRECPENFAMILVATMEGPVCYLQLNVHSLILSSFL